MEKKSKSGVSKGLKSCEFCEFYDYDPESDTYSCFMSLDEDELASFIGLCSGSCPYFRFYDEYKSVQKQN